jgi:2-dehydro-3-deoxyphosphogalactonate aldolase
MNKSFVSEQIAALPIVAILRGVIPSEAISIGTALYDAGIRVLEVTMNSIEPLKSIEFLAAHFEGKMAVGAGTVLTPEQVDQVHEVGGVFIVSPNTNTRVISRTAELGMYSLPGAATCSECFQAIDAGADALKIFPASVVGPAGLKDLTAVIPKDISLFAVGGVNEKKYGRLAQRRSQRRRSGVEPLQSWRYSRGIKPQGRGDDRCLSDGVGGIETVPQAPL